MKDKKKAVVGTQGGTFRINCPDLRDRAGGLGHLESGGEGVTQSDGREGEG